MDRRRILRLQAAYYVATGLFPFVSRRAFEAVTGRKTDWWLVQMVGLLAFTNGLAIGVAAEAGELSPEAVTLSLMSALSFAAIDTVYALQGRISPVYLADAAVELALVAALAR